MLLNSGLMGHQPTTNMPPYTTVDSLLEDVSRQMRMASMELSKRQSRASMGQRPVGNSMVHPMRIVKPSSANSSPQRPLAGVRRRTLMNDGASYRRPSVLEQHSIPAGYETFQQNTVRTNRPVSWHPSTVPQPTYVPTPFQYQTDAGYSPYSPSDYSGYTSPASLSPTYTPYTDIYNQSYQPANMQGFYPQSYVNQAPVQVAVSATYAMRPVQPVPAPYPQQITDPSVHSNFEWNNFAQNGFDAVTTPPTPENPIQMQSHEPSLLVEDSTPYHPLDEAEEEGEELVGLGLYDMPEKTASEADINNYHGALASYTLGLGHRKQEPEGKGLKLEETWNPPTSDDEEDDDD